MRWLNMDKIRWVFFGIGVAVALAGGHVRADFTFGEPTNLGPTVNSSRPDEVPSISADGLSLYFCSNRYGTYGELDIWVTTRETKDDEWGPPVNVGPLINTPQRDAAPNLSADGLTLFFYSIRSGGYGKEDLWVTTRATKEDEWGTPLNLGPPINTSSAEFWPGISADGLSLYFCSDRPGGYGDWDIWLATRRSKEDPWGEPVNLGDTVNSSSYEQGLSISADGLSLYFGSGRPGGAGGSDLWVTTRATKEDDWGVPVNLGPPINTWSAEACVSIPADGSTMFFTSNRPGGYGGFDTWQASIIPIADFNGDGIVDAADMCIMVDHWGENYPLCDIGPMPWGDGVVDVEDLKVLAEHLFEEPALIACWKLDEAEGNVARESISGVDDVVMGDPLWQPTRGNVDGALELDGVDDYVICSFKPNPLDGPFSVFAWVTGGAPGQVIISQSAGANWLLTDQDGKLMTELGKIARIPPLQSQAVITDGQWHNVGLVWDGSNRTLYVDGVVVAEDTLSSVGASGGSLYIGAEKDLASNSFFSGLIDDVRIYDRAVQP